jgi:glutaminyl-tRNA synthetase
MPTLSGMRRRGYTPEAIRAFCERIGVAKRDSTVELALLEHAVRDDLNRRAPRTMGVLDPVKVVIENYPEGKTDTMSVQVNPEDPSPASEPFPSSARSTSSATTSARRRLRSTGGCSPGTKCACAAPTS